MRFPIGRASLAATLAGASLLLIPSGAQAAGEKTNATAVKSTVLDYPLTVGQANCPGVPNASLSP